MTDTTRNVINLADRKKQRLTASAPSLIPDSIPDFIDPPTILSMTDEQIDEMLNHIRINRMRVTLIYKKNEEEKAKIADEKLRGKIEKKAEQICTELERFFKAHDKLELRINELRGLRLQVGLDMDPEGSEVNETTA